MTETDARKLAEKWMDAWNAHDLELIMEHYEEKIELTSPIAERLLPGSGGKVVGKAKLRDYFQRALETYPNLQFRLTDVLWGINSVVFYYINQKGQHVGEFMELSATGKAARVVAHYSS